MILPGFCGPSYKLRSVNAAAQQCMNLYPEAMERETGKASGKVILSPSPGLRQFASGPSTGRSCLTIADRSFFVLAGTFYEVSSLGVLTNRGSVTNDTLPAGLAASSTQILISSGGNLYTFILASNTFAAVTMAGHLASNVVMIEYCDGYFIALLDDGRFQISSLNDATLWALADISGIQRLTDKAVTCKVDHNELWFLGGRNGVAYYNSGNPSFPFSPIQTAYIEQGTAAPWSCSLIDNSFVWLSQNRNGACMFFRMVGYLPQRISDLGVEYALQQYLRQYGMAGISDAVSYAFQIEGHEFYHVYFPTAGASWRYDVSVNAWHEVGWWDGAHGIFRAHLSRCHTFNFGKHLVADWNSGLIYDLSNDYLDDNGAPLRRVRRSPHLANQRDPVVYGQLEIDMDTGIGPIPHLLDGAGNARAPQVMLRLSNDGAKTWMAERIAYAGKAGEYEARVAWNMLGQSRRRVFEVSWSDPVSFSITDAYVTLGEEK